MLVEEAIKRQNEKFDLLLHEMDKRFEQVDKRFEDVIHQMDKRFNTLQWLGLLGFTLIAVLMSLYQFLSGS